jgi:HD superfamily phosphohydrolase
VKDIVMTYDWDVAELVRRLAEIYKHRGLDWAAEKATVETRLQAICQRLSFRYVEPHAKAVGGSGIILSVIDKQLSRQLCALKFPRPVPGKVELLGEMLDKEISHLSALRHSSVVRIHGWEKVPEDLKSQKEFPYYVMDYIEGSPSTEYFRNRDLAEKDFIAVVEATMHALSYIHAKSIAHLDIKPDNILVGSSAVPVIADLGTAKALTGESKQTIIACTSGYADPELMHFLEKDPSSTNRHKGSLAKDKIECRWDFYSFGKTLLNWLGFDLEGKDIPRSEKLSPYVRKYFLLMAARLLRGRVDTWLEDRIGLDRRLLKELEYSTIERTLEDVRKLTGAYSLVDIVPELNPYHSETLQVAGSYPTTYTARVRKVLEHPALRRLASIRQLGLVSQLYPTATHTRLEHSLGTYHNACRFAMSLYYDPFSPLFRQVVDSTDLCALLLTALLHDVGQFPLAHDLEEIDPTMFSHKQLGAAVLRGERDMKVAGSKKIVLTPFDDTLKPWGVPPERILEILDAKPDRDDKPLKDRLLRSIIDGPIDADKLDYLPRDSERLKVPYGDGIDAQRIMRSLTVALDRKGKNTTACVGIHEKSKVAAEFVAMARYAMFSQAYWHHTVRSMKSMLSRAVLRTVELAEAGGTRGRHEFRSSFEEFVLTLPGVLYKRTPIQEPLLDTRKRRTAAVASESIPLDTVTSESTIAATDAAVLAFIRSFLFDRSAVESELLDDLLCRHLYKRLFVFSHERSQSEWELFTEKWDRLTVKAKLRVYESIEKSLVRAVLDRVRDGPHTTILTQAQTDRLQVRVGAGKPIVLIDIPGNRPGSDIPLYYVVESQRRALRRDERAVGDVHPSGLWRLFDSGMREGAGKVRIFCHPSLVDFVEAAVQRDDFVRLFEAAVASVS